MTGAWGWIIIGLPVIGFLITGLLLRRLPKFLRRRDS